MTRRAEIYRFEWSRILIEVTYEPEWLPAHILGEHVARLEVRSIYSTDAPLPIAGTGYRLHFIAASTIADIGGSIAYLDAWLTVESDSRVWREYEQSTRQFTVFWSECIVGGSPAMQCGGSELRTARQPWSDDHAPFRLLAIDIVERCHRRVPFHRAFLRLAKLP